MHLLLGASGKLASSAVSSQTTLKDMRETSGQWCGLQHLMPALTCSAALHQSDQAHEMTLR